MAQFSNGQTVQVVSEVGSVDPIPPQHFLGRSGVINNTLEMAGQIRYDVRFDDDGSSQYLFEQWLLANQ